MTITLLLLVTSFAMVALVTPPSAVAIKGSDRSRELIVAFDPEASRSQENRVIDRAEAKVSKRINRLDIALVTVDEGNDRITAELKLERSGIVSYAEPNYRLEAAGIPNDPQFSLLWGLQNSGQSGVQGADIGATQVWDQISGSQVVVAVVDTGVDYSHPDLAANIWSNKDEIGGNEIDDDGNGYVDDVHGIDTFNDDSDPLDDNSHGTHVAGTVGAVGNNGIGVTGVSWNARIMPLKFLGANGSGYTSDAIEAINYATDNGARIINASWGGGGYSQALRDAIDSFGASGGLFVAAAGNSGLNTDTSPSYPAAYSLDNIVSVAASTSSDSLAGFSNYGKSSVDLAAPGQTIFSTGPGNTYFYASGTSMATPHVAGAASLYMQSNQDANPSQVRQALIVSSEKLATFSGKTVSDGRLYLPKLFQIPVPPSPTTPTEGSVNATVPLPHGSGSGEDGDRPTLTSSASKIKSKHGRTRARKISLR